MDKLNDYQGVTGRVHGVRDKVKERVDAWKTEHPAGLTSWLKRDPQTQGPPKLERTLQDYQHVYRYDVLNESKATVSMLVRRATPNSLASFGTKINLD